MREHDRIMDDLWKPSLRNQVVMLVLAIVLVVIGLTMELRPIIRLKDELVARDPMSLSPIRPGQLPIELRPIVEAINQYIQRLNAQIAAQKRFIADAAHQLRTPLTLLDSQIQFARQVDDRASQSETLKAIHGSSRGMADLVNKLLLLSQAEASNTIAFLRQPVDMIAVSSNVLVELIGLAQRKNIDLGLDAQTEQAWVIGNEGLLTAMVMNLVDNAIRYTQPGGKVTVSVTCDEKRVELIVVDNGPGISAEARTRVFERFYRNAAPGQEGTGLGLAIVKEIVQAAQGTVTLAPKREAEGLAVIVELPPAV
jgi:two-component system sensor histidine kinase TctE